MTPLYDRRPINFRQVCAIARTVLEADPTLADHEWSEQTKEKAARQGYDSIPPDLLSRALPQVERALVQILGPRPTASPTIPPPPLPAPRSPDPKWKRLPPSAKGWASIAELIATLTGMMDSSSSDASSGALPEATADETLAISEAAVLQQFWQDVSAGADRLAMLQTFAELAIARPVEWDPAAVRAAADRPLGGADRCFACCNGDRPLDWHHVVQIQHGGSNTRRNRVPLCEYCHRRIHPWLPQEDRARPSGFTKLIDIYNNLQDTETNESGPRGAAASGSDPRAVVRPGTGATETPPARDEAEEVKGRA